MFRYRLSVHVQSGSCEQRLHLRFCCLLKVVHLDKDDERQKIPLQPPYYDMAQSESTAFTDKPVSSTAKLIAVCPFSCFGGNVVNRSLRSDCLGAHLLMHVARDKLPSERCLDEKRNPRGLIFRLVLCQLRTDDKGL